MVSKKKLDCGFNGYRAPLIPRAPRSIRKRGPRKKLVEDNQLCAFELLAAVAGKLLLESESSASSNVAEGKLGSSRDRNDKVQPKLAGKALKSESFDHGSCTESTFFPKMSVDKRNLLPKFNGSHQAENDQVVEQTIVHASSDLVEKNDCDVKLGISEEKSLDEDATCKIGSSNGICESLNCKVESGSEMQMEDDKNQIHLSMANTSTVHDPISEYVNTNVLPNPESSVKFPLYRDSIPGALLKKWHNNVKLGSRDNDENSFRCDKSSTKSRHSRPQPRIVRHRMRKMTASKYWKAAPKQKDYKLYNTSEVMKSFHRYRKSSYARENCQRAPLKKRKLYDHSFGTTFDQEQSSDSITNSPVKVMRADMNSSASGASTKGHTKAKDPHVRFSIKSFKVPELYIDVPETASVGSLKRTVMDAVAAILGGGIRVGVVFQGKKVGDDRRTLQQAGISQCASTDNLGFVLEPSFTHVSPSDTPKKIPVLSPCDAEKSMPRSPISPMTHSGVSNASMGPKLDNNEYMSPPTTHDNLLTLIDGAVVDSKALIPVPALNAEALSAVPSNFKSRRIEMSQRRTRRPFSVGEVEALVEAVEMLGTGRWRDVKMRAFEDADHRTYVDLKDKWKTLVHTASISPQQRRGEPVPQELLVRVLSAHSYWSQHQSRQHGKHTGEPLNVEGIQIGA